MEEELMVHIVLSHLTRTHNKEIYRAFETV